MARTSAIISLVVIFVLAVLINNEVQASQCMSKCNKKCLQTHKLNGVSCGVQCFVQCMSDNPKSKLSPEMKTKLADLKKKAITGAISQDDVEDELREIALYMMAASESDLHHHSSKELGEKPRKAPKQALKEDDDDITDDDDKPKKH